MPLQLLLTLSAHAQESYSSHFVCLRNRIFKGFHTFDFVLNDHNYITLLYMHINFYFQFQCESVVFTN